MSLKVLCPKCRTEARDPADLRSVTCPACAAVFDGRSAPLAFWIGAGVLCALVLVALWLTAWQVKRQKMAARYGEDPVPVASDQPLLSVSAKREVSIRGLQAKTLEEFFAVAAKEHPGQEMDVELDPLASAERQREILEEAAKRQVPVRFVAGEGKPLKLVFERGRPLRVEHFSIEYSARDQAIAVSKARGPELVRFGNLKSGGLRRWHELELSLYECSPESVSAELVLKPGAPCFGDGRYRLLRPGLRVEFPGGLAAVVVAWNARKPEMILRLESGRVREDRTLGAGPQGQALGMTYRLLAEEDGSHALILRTD